jgi:predicted transposase YdaD
MRDSDTCMYILEEGPKKGFKKGLNQGREKGHEDHRATRSGLQAERILDIATWQELLAR